MHILFCLLNKNSKPLFFHGLQISPHSGGAAMRRAAIPASCQTWSWVCNMSLRCRHRCTSCAARMKWVCRCSTEHAYNWSSAQRAGHRPGWTLCVCFVGRCKSCRGRPPPSLPRHIPSPTHFHKLGSRFSAGFFAPPAAMVGPASSGRFVGCGSSTFTCGA